MGYNTMRDYALFDIQLMERSLNKPPRRLSNYLTEGDFDTIKLGYWIPSSFYTGTEEVDNKVGWLDEQRSKAELEAHRERVRQVFSRSFGAAMKSSEWVQALMYVEAARDLPELQAVCRAFEIHWEDKGDMVTKDVKINQLKAQIDSLKAQVELLELGRMGHEPANGTVYKIEKRYQKFGAGYAFAAIRADGLWYLTGTGVDGTKKYTWDELKRFIGTYSRVWEMTSRKELVD